MKSCFLVSEKRQRNSGELFSTDYNGLVAVTDIPFYSMCEHHLLPFFGTVDVIYQPHSGCVAGLSKFNDVITVLSRKPQLQERLTREIADAIERDLSAEGVFVRLKNNTIMYVDEGDFATRLASCYYRK